MFLLFSASLSHPHNFALGLSYYPIKSDGENPLSQGSKSSALAHSSNALWERNPWVVDCAKCKFPPVLSEVCALKNLPQNETVTVKTFPFPIALLWTNVRCLQEWLIKWIIYRYLLSQVLCDFIRPNQGVYSSSSVSSVKRSAKSATVRTEASDCFMEELVWLWERGGCRHQRPDELT